MEDSKKVETCPQNSSQQVQVTQEDIAEALKMLPSLMETLNLNTYTSSQETSRETGHSNSELAIPTHKPS